MGGILDLTIKKNDKELLVRRRAVGLLVTSKSDIWVKLNNLDISAWKNKARMVIATVFEENFNF